MHHPPVCFPGNTYITFLMSERLTGIKINHMVGHNRSLTIQMSHFCFSQLFSVNMCLRVCF